jgi:hypothetical protein
MYLFLDAIFSYSVTVDELAEGSEVLPDSSGEVVPVAEAT